MREAPLTSKIFRLPTAEANIVLPADEAALIQKGGHSIFLAHEMGHYLACVRYRVDATLPFFIPAPTLAGTFGAVIRIRSVIPNRRALFDIGVAGPLAGFVVAVPVLGWAFRRMVAERMGTILLSALIAHTAWHWMTDRGRTLGEYDWSLPAWDVALAIALDQLWPGSPGMFAG